MRIIMLRETFPSLIKEPSVKLSENQTIFHGFNESKIEGVVLYLYTAESIFKTTIDKQRVREAIDKVFPPKARLFTSPAYRLLKELGLEVRK